MQEDNKETSVNTSQELINELKMKLEANDLAGFIELTKAEINRLEARIPEFSTDSKKPIPEGIFEIYDFIGKSIEMFNEHSEIGAVLHGYTRYRNYIGEVIDMVIKNKREQGMINIEYNPNK